MALFAAMGAWVLIDVLRRTGKGAGLEAFARANGLELSRSVAARDYAGSRFRSGKRIILRSLRTPAVPALEVGDSWPVERIRYSMRSSDSLTTVSAANAPQAEGFLRVALPGRSHPPQEDTAPFPMTPQLDAALGELLGPYTLEVHHREVTVMGSHPLHPDQPERVTAAFQLADALARQAGLSPTSSLGAAGAPTPEGSRREGGRRTRHPLAIVAAVLAYMIVLPVGFAIVMSILDDTDLGMGAAGVTMLLLFVVASALIVLLIRWATAGRRRPRDRDRDSGRERQEPLEDALR